MLCTANPMQPTVCDLPVARQAGEARKADVSAANQWPAPGSQSFARRQSSAHE